MMFCLPPSFAYCTILLLCNRVFTPLPYDALFALRAERLSVYICGCCFLIIFLMLAKPPQHHYFPPPFASVFVSTNGDRGDG